MKTIKTIAIGTLAVTGLFFSAAASALPGKSDFAPQSSIDICIAQIADKANYENSGRVLHRVDSKLRRVSGYMMNISTFVFDENGTEVIREYRSSCAVSGKQETTLFKIKEAGDTA